MMTVAELIAYLQEHPQITAAWLASKTGTKANYENPLLR
jgi:hypothetical protein